MPNWCSNQLYFSGAEEKVMEARTLFNEMMLNSEKTNEGQKPDFIGEMKEGYFFDIYAYLEDDEQISYETRWTPNTADVVVIADHFGLGFELTYQELGNCVFGKAIYKDGELTELDLLENDTNKITYREVSDKYFYKNDEYESDIEPLEMLFEEKFGQPY